MGTMAGKTSFALGTSLVCGFLGAGKTTFIMEQLKSTRGRTAVLVNEFGVLGIDGSLIRSAGVVNVVEIPGGCICCSQQAGLVESIRTIAEEIQPDVLLIEPSGIAEASEVIKVLEDEALSDVIRLDAVIAIVDASTFLEFSEPEAFGAFFLDQVTNADLIVVNKADLVSPTERQRVAQRLLELNPVALAVETAFCRMETPLPSKRKKAGRSFGNSEPGMECVSITPEYPLSEDLLEKFTSAIYQGKFGKVFRAKGFLPTPDGGSVNLQIVGRTLSVTPFYEEVRPRLILIGYNLDGEQVSEFFKSNRKST